MKSTSEDLLFHAVEKLGGELRIPLEALYILPEQGATMTSTMENRELVLRTRRFAFRFVTGHPPPQDVVDVELVEPDTPTLPCEERPRL